MFIIELIITVAELIDEVRFSKRFGFGGFLWGVGGTICLVTAKQFFDSGLTVSGILGIVATVACFVCMVVRSCRDVEKT